MSFQFRKLQFFKKQQWLEKLKQDASNIQNTMDYINERLDNPCDIYDTSQCRSTEQMLKQEIEDVEQQQSDMEQYIELCRQNDDDMKTFIAQTDGFINYIQTNLNDMENHLAKFGMKPMACDPIAENKDIMVASTENGVQS